MVFKYADGTLEIDFTAFIEYQATQSKLKKLLKLDSSNAHEMTTALDVMCNDIKREYKRVIDDAQIEIDKVDCLFLTDREKERKKIRMKRDAKRKSLNSKYEKLQKFIRIVEVYTNEQIQTR